MNLSLLTSIILHIWWFVIELSHSDLGFSILIHSLEVIRGIMSHSDGPASINVSSWMTTELLRPGYSNISRTEDQCAFSGASDVHWVRRKKKLRKKDSVFEKTTVIFFKPFCKREREIISQYKGEHSIRFKQLLVKEILVNGPSRFDFMVP